MKIIEERKQIINGLNFKFEKQIIKAAKRANFYAQQFTQDIWEIACKYIDDSPLADLKSETDLNSFNWDKIKRPDRLKSTFLAGSKFGTQESVIEAGFTNHGVTRSLMKLLDDLDQKTS